jgi:hypothetical protein
MTGWGRGEGGRGVGRTSWLIGVRYNGQGGRGGGGGGRRMPGIKEEVIRKQVKVQVLLLLRSGHPRSCAGGNRSCGSRMAREILGVDLF